MFISNFVICISIVEIHTPVIQKILEEKLEELKLSVFFLSFSNILVNCNMTKLITHVSDYLTLNILILLEFNIQGSILAPIL